MYYHEGAVRKRLRERLSHTPCLASSDHAVPNRVDWKSDRNGQRLTEDAAPLQGTCHGADESRRRNRRRPDAGRAPPPFDRNAPRSQTRRGRRRRAHSRSAVNTGGRLRAVARMRRERTRRAVCTAQSVLPRCNACVTRCVLCGAYYLVQLCGADAVRGTGTAQGGNARQKCNARQKQSFVSLGCRETVGLLSDTPRKRAYRRRRGLPSGARLSSNYLSGLRGDLPGRVVSRCDAEHRAVR